MKLALRSTVFVVVLTILLGGAYPAAVTALAHLFWRDRADGSFISAGGRIVGSELIGQNFQDAGYLHPRPSAAGKDGYDPTASGGSNKGPTDADLAKAIAARVAAARRDRPGDPASRSGRPGHGFLLRARPAPFPRRSAVAGCPHREGARRRGRKGRRSDPTAHRAAHARLLGEPRVNVLRANLDLDRSFPRR
jgi:K+-transporting ATPase ATPase C chain